MASAATVDKISKTRERPSNTGCRVGNKLTVAILATDLDNKRQQQHTLQQLIRVVSSQNYAAKIISVHSNRFRSLFPCRFTGKYLTPRPQRPIQDLLRGRGRTTAITEQSMGVWGGDPRGGHGQSPLR